MSDPTHARNTDDRATSAASVATAVVLSLIVVGASFTLSFSALADLARMSGAIPDPLTPLLPVVIDVFILQATWCVYVATKRRDDAGRRYHFAMLAIFSTVSVAGNAGHAFLATDQGVMHGLMAVAIAIVAPLALLASIHGLVMHVWTGGDPTPRRIDVRDISDSHFDPEPDAYAHDQLDDGAPRAHPQVAASSLIEQAEHETRGHDGTSLLTLAEVDEQTTDNDLYLARLVRSRGRITKTERVIARALVLERLRVPREDTATLTGVHRTTIGRWMELAAECRADADVHTHTEHARSESAGSILVDAQ